MAVNITPLHDRVLVRRLEEKETVKGGIIIPDSAREKPQEGEVVAVGAGRMEKGTRIPLDVKPGDKILFGKYSGNDIKIDGEEFMIMKEDEILAKIGGQAKAAGGKKKLPGTLHCWSVSQDHSTENAGCEEASKQLRRESTGPTAKKRQHLEIRRKEN